MAVSEERRTRCEKGTRRVNACLFRSLHVLSRRKKEEEKSPTLGMP